MILPLLQKLENNISSFDNNSLLIRFVLAFSVFYSHMFAIYGLSEPTFLFGNHSLGWYAVNGFFFISGLLVAQSYESRDLKSYVLARILRIIPAYLMSLVLVLISVYFFSNISFNLEWVIKFIKFLFNNLIPLDSVDMSMSGAWTNTGQPNALNNSAWTIPFEIFCYIIIIPLFLNNKKFSIKMFLLFSIVIFIYLKELGAISLNHISFDLLRVIIYFAIGTASYIIIKNKKINLYFIVSFFSLFLFEGNLTETLMGYTIIALVLFFGFYLKAILVLKDDYSYGLYLYAWPISQSVNGWGGIQNIYLVLFIAFIILFILSFLSWKYLEKPFIKMKKMTNIKI